MQNYMYQLNEPYPDVSIVSPNAGYADVLARDFASHSGELTSLNQYLYQHWILNTAAPDISIALLKIAQVEMLHLEMLGKLITILGGTPRYQYFENGRPVSWNINYINYTKNTKSMLLSNIAAEKSAIDSYISHSKSIKDIKVSNILLRIAEDEKLHLRILKNYLSKL